MLDLFFIFVYNDFEIKSKEMSFNMNKTFLVIALCAALICGGSAEAAEKYVIEPHFLNARKFVGSLADVTDENGRRAAVKRDGTFAVLPEGYEWNIRANGLLEVLGEDGKTAFYNANGEKLTDFIYDAYFKEQGKGSNAEKTWYPMSISDGDGESDLIRVSRGNKFGFINSEGKEVIACTFDYADGFYDGMARIGSEGILSTYGTYICGKWGYINLKGEAVIPPTWWVASVFIDGTACVSNGVSMITDKNGNLSENGGYQAVCGGKYNIIYDENDNFGVTDAQGNIIIPMIYGTIQNFGDCFVVSNAFILNNKGEKIYDSFDGISVSSQGYPYKSSVARVLVKAEDFTESSPHVYYGIVNGSGKMALAHEYDKITDLGDGVLYAVKDGKAAFYDYDGNKITDTSVTEIYGFSEGVAAARNAEGKWGYIKNPLDISIFKDGKEVFCDVPAYIQNSRTMVPVRAVSEALGAEVLWDGVKREVTVLKENKEIKMVIESDIISDGANTVSTDAPPVIKDGRTFLPLRVCCELLMCNVQWDEDTRCVYISQADA